MAKRLTSKEISNSVSDNDKYIDKLRIEISKLSYEDSLNKLDILLDKLKNEDLLVQDLQKSFLQGSLYIEHCESLLNKVEQEVLEINEGDLK